MVRHENEQANKEAGSQGAGASWSQIPSAVDLRGMAAGNSSDTAVVASIRPEDSPRTGVPRNPSERGGAGRKQARRGWPRWIGMDGSRDEVKVPRAAIDWRERAIVCTYTDTPAAITTPSLPCAVVACRVPKKPARVHSLLHASVSSVTGSGTRRGRMDSVDCLLLTQGCKRPGPSCSRKPRRDDLLYEVVPLPLLVVPSCCTGRQRER